VSADATAAPARWPLVEWAAEALGLGIFMVSACAFTALLEHPASPARLALPNADLRRALIGAAMGLTAIGLVYSPWGRRSGAHLNPSVTLAFLRLGRVRPRDAAGYVAAQFVGGALGVLACASVLGPRLADPAVRYAVTVPGAGGAGGAFAIELAMAFGLMSLVLRMSASERWRRWTGVGAGLTVFTYISLLGPLSGMSMNPARTLASAFPAHVWTALWLYFVAPPLGMQLAVEAHRRWHPDPRAGCAKLHHPGAVRCIFCEHRDAARVARGAAAG
jgi:aquaporin Z